MESYNEVIDEARQLRKMMNFRRSIFKYKGQNENINKKLNELRTNDKELFDYVIFLEKTNGALKMPSDCTKYEPQPQTDLGPKIVNIQGEMDQLQMCLVGLETSFLKLKLYMDELKTQYSESQ